MPHAGPGVSRSARAPGRAPRGGAGGLGGRAPLVDFGKSKAVVPGPGTAPLARLSPARHRIGRVVRSVKSSRDGEACGFHLLRSGIADIEHHRSLVHLEMPLNPPKIAQAQFIFGQGGRTTHTGKCGGLGAAALVVS